MDTLTPSQRSTRMSLIHGSETKPEMVMRQFIRDLGFRFTVNRADLPGTPDLVFEKRRKVIFVHGCFWHRHNRCSLARLPKSRLDFWEPKLARNRARDSLNRRNLTKQGWKSLVIWECELRNPFKVMMKTLAFLEE